MRSLVLSYSIRNNTYGWIRFLSKSSKPRFWVICFDFLDPPEPTERNIKNWASFLFLLHTSSFFLQHYLTSCKKAKKTKEPIRDNDL